MHMRIELSCRACGHNRFSFPETGGDEALVICTDCGHEVGTVGQLKEQVAETVLSRAWMRESGPDVGAHDRSDDKA